MRHARKSFKKYTRLVAEQGTASPCAKAFRRERQDDGDFASLARLTDFLFKRMEQAGVVPVVCDKDIATSRIR